jgi:protein O-GlcNAc transferase
MTSSCFSQKEVGPAIKLFSSGKYKESLESLSELKNQYPDEPLIFNIKGACYAGLGEYQKAITHYKKAIAIDPNYYKAYFNLAGTYEEMGQFNDSVNSYKESLKIKPDYLEAHYSLGRSYQVMGKFSKAIDSYKNVLAIKPDFAEMHNNLGVLLQEQNKLSEAKRHLESALNIMPDFKEAHNNLGNLLKALGDSKEAVKSYQKAISIDSKYVDAYDNLASAFSNLNELDNAVKCYRESSNIDSNNPERQYNLGFNLQKLGKFNEAMDHYRKALAINPGYAEAHNNLGISLKELGQLNEAIESYQKTISINPKFTQAYNNIGNVLMELGQTDDAIQSYKKALDINPAYAEAHNNLGIALMNMGKLDEATDCYKKAVEIMPDYADAFINLGIISNMIGQLDKAHKYFNKAQNIDPLIPEIYSNLGNLFIDFKNLSEAENNYDQAYNLKPNDYYNLGNLLHTKMHLCKWDKSEILIKNLFSKFSKNDKVCEPFPLLALIDDPELHKKAAEIYINHKFPENFDLGKISIYPLHKKIRIGYFSADFRVHPVANLTAELYEIHDKDKFEIYAFSFGPDTGDEMNLRIKSGVDYFHHVRSMSHKEVAALSRSLEIDIAVDLGGFTQDTRTGIFAMRAAPIQVNYLGYSSTMGANYMDYIIADHILIPQDKQKYYSEKIVYLPDSFMVNDTKKKISSRVFTRKEAGLPSEGFIFSCFNHHYKITPSVFKSWMRILLQVDGSVLWLSDGNTTGINNLKNTALKEGVDEKRLIFAPRLELREDHLNRIKLADLFLDTLPYNAHATTSDALQVGLPVLTQVGNAFASRVAASLINSVNLPELITTNQKQYEELAIELANKTKKLEMIKDKLAKNILISPLYNTPLYTKQLEAAYSEMYRRYHQGLKLDHIVAK